MCLHCHQITGTCNPLLVTRGPGVPGRARQNVGMPSGMARGDPCCPRGLLNPPRYDDMHALPSRLHGTCPEVGGHAVRGVIPMVTRAGQGRGWWMTPPQQALGGGALSSLIPLANHILIEFRRTCKKLVRFCHSIFLTNVPVIPGK